MRWRAVLSCADGVASDHALRALEDLRLHCAGETQRKASVTGRDPVRTVKLSAWTKERIQQAHQVHGAALAQAVAAIPPEVSAQLQAM